MIKQRRELLQAAVSLAVAPSFPQARTGRKRSHPPRDRGRERPGFCLHEEPARNEGDNVEVAALCDVDSTVLTRRAADYGKLTNGKRVLRSTTCDA